MHMVIRLYPLVMCLGASMLAAFVNTYLAAQTLNCQLPGFAPTCAGFRAVWTGIYLLMGLSAYLVYTRQGLGRSDRNSSIGLYGIVLLGCCLWNLLFFRFQLLVLPACWAVALLAAAWLCAALFYRLRRTAGMLLIPLCLWLAFTAAVNIWTVAIN